MPQSALSSLVSEHLAGRTTILVEQLDRVARHTKADNDGRRGRIFSLRLTDEERAELERLEGLSRSDRPWDYTRRQGSLGAFIVWAALQYRPAALKSSPPRRRPRNRAKR